MSVKCISLHHNPLILLREIFFLHLHCTRGKYLQMASSSSKIASETALDPRPTSLAALTWKSNATWSCHMQHLQSHITTRGKTQNLHTQKKPDSRPPAMSHMEIAAPKRAHLSVTHPTHSASYVFCIAHNTQTHCSHLLPLKDACHHLSYALFDVFNSHLSQQFPLYVTCHKNP